MGAALFFRWQAVQVQQPAPVASPIYARADVDRILMSHPAYATYHQQELEYRRLSSQYEAACRESALQMAAEAQLTRQDELAAQARQIMMEADIREKQEQKEQEVQEKVLKRYAALAAGESEQASSAAKEETLQLVNLQLQEQNSGLSREERQQLRRQWQQHVQQMRYGTTGKLSPQDAKALADYQQRLQSECDVYRRQLQQQERLRQEQRLAAQIRQREARRAQQMTAVQQRKWQQRLAQKQKRLVDLREKMIADIRTQAAAVAHEQGLALIVDTPYPEGEARDVTDDIIIKMK
jgi:outer membrane protein